MNTKFLITLICCFAIVPLAMGAQDTNTAKKKQQKRQTQQVQSGKGAMGKKSGGGGGQGQLGLGKGKKSGGGKMLGQDGTVGKGRHLGEKGLKGHDGKLAGTGTGKMKNYDLKINKRIKRVAFRRNGRIIGAEHWRGHQYDVFRDYVAVWHDHFWWQARYPRIVFVLGGWYYWNGGWWYPAWGYAPHSYYVYDGPIRAHHDLTPDQVTANVQSQLQEEGYYHGEIDGLLGPLTRAALSDYQRDHGLEVTSAIDEPTLDALGMA